MSLLGAPVYANSATPLWVSATGDTINGDLTLTGSLDVAQTITARDDLQCIDPSTSADGLRLTAAGGNGFIQSPTTIQFTRIGTSSANTSLTISPFSAGSPADVLSVGGTLSTRRLAVSTAAGGGLGVGSISVGSSSGFVGSSAVTANSKIFLQHNAPGVAGPAAGPAQGILSVAAINPGVGFSAELVDLDGVSRIATNVPATFWYLIIN